MTKSDKQTDIIEEVMKRAYLETPHSVLLPDEWQDSLMAIVNESCAPDDFEVERVEKTLIAVSWIAAGIAAALIIMSGIFYSVQSDNFENDIQALYADNLSDIPGEYKEIF